jgi:hypothetical protein
MDEPKPGRFRYTGSAREYLRQALINTSLAAGLCLALFLLVLVIDQFLLGRGYIQSVHVALLTLLVMVWGLLLVQMALALGKFEIVVDDNGLTFHRSGRSDYVPFTEIESVDIINRPMWWAMRTDLKPLALTSRHMIRILRINKPYLTFAGGIEDEERLLEILQTRIER